MTKTRQIPVGACLFRLQNVDLEHVEPLVEGGAATRKFKGNAHTGEPFSDLWHGQAIVDLESLKIPRQDVPVLKDHHTEIGFTEKLTVGENGLEVEGVLLGVNKLGRETIAFLDAKMPFQMSVYVPPERIQVLDEGEEAEVNGKLRQGPLAIWRDCALRETTVTALGRDGNTSVSLLSGSRGRDSLEVPITHEGGTMGNEKSGGSDVAPLTVARLQADHSDVHEAVFAAGREEGKRLGIEAERKRIVEIRERGKGVEAELVQKAIDDGLSLEEAKDSFLSYHASRKEGRLAAVRAEHAATVGTDDPEPELADIDPSDPSGKAAKAQLAKLPEGEEKWKKQYEQHGDDELGMSAEQLQDEYGDVEFYLADKRHLAKQR